MQTKTRGSWLLATVYKPDTICLLNSPCAEKYWPMSKRAIKLGLWNDDTRGKYKCVSLFTVFRKQQVWLYLSTWHEDPPPNGPTWFSPTQSPQCLSTVPHNSRIFVQKISIVTVNREVMNGQYSTMVQSNSIIRGPCVKISHLVYVL